MIDNDENLGNTEEESGSSDPKWISTKALYGGVVDFAGEGLHLEMSHTTLQYIIENSEDELSNDGKLFGRTIQYDDNLESRIVKMIRDDGHEVMEYKVSNHDDMLEDDV